MNHDLFLMLLLAHLIGDFYCQTDKTCADKRRRKWRSPHLYFHSVVIGVLSFVAVWKIEFLPWMLMLIASHLLIDGIKSGRENKLEHFLLDQALHLAVIVIIAMICTCQIGWMQTINLNIGAINLPVFITALLLCLKPANLLVRCVLEKYHILEEEPLQEEPMSVGALIGSLERSLFLLFVVMGQYGAVGFILAAKSIIRYKEGSTRKTEYVLAGTLMSLGIAVATGVLVRLLSPLFL